MKPTIIIPGIKGTKLADTNTLDFDVIWSGLQSKYETIYDLALDAKAKFEQSPESIIERSDVEDLAYKEAFYIIKRKLGGRVYIFGYDWRRSCVDNGKKLKAFVEYLKAKLGETSFNFITHSMGGIVFACFLKTLRGDYSCLEKATLTVCPFKGSINAFIGLIKGEGGIKFPFLNPNDEFRKIARTFPSVYELCPTYKNAVTFEPGHNLSGQDFDVINPKHWQSNIQNDPIFVQRLNELKDFLTDNPGMLNLARLNKKIRDKLLIVLGIGEKTKHSVVIRAQDKTGRVSNFFDFDHEKADGDGDGTVPVESSAFYKNAILTLSVESKWYDQANHGFFLNDGRVQSVIRRFFAGDTRAPQWWSDIGGTVQRKT
ncbi:MAG: hypothetical protein JSV83_11285 [Desulfobacterales bacterium]|nr:MAG: hypothetical protein JSV83_11285 [Desulfobacterales bacterium]